MTENQHYIPQFYLKNFAVSGNTEQIIVYTRDGKIFPSNVRNVASQKDYYTFLDKNTGEQRNDIEEGFAFLEKESAPIIKKIIETRSVSLSEKDFLYYVNSLLFRM